MIYAQMFKNTKEFPKLMRMSGIHACGDLILYNEGLKMFLYDQLTEETATAVCVDEREVSEVFIAFMQFDEPGAVFLSKFPSMKD